MRLKAITLMTLKDHRRYKKALREGWVLCKYGYSTILLRKGV